MRITTLSTIIERRKREGKRELTTPEIEEILMAGAYDESKYEVP